MPAKKGKGKSKSKTGKRRGRKSWGGDGGAKLEFLLSFEQEYLETTDPGGLYTRMTAQFLEKYGYDLPFDAEPEQGFVPVICNLADLPYDEQVVEQEKRDAISMKLRLKIGAWMRHRFHRKQTDEDMVADLLRTMSELTMERPRRRTAMNIYWADNYSSKIRKEFQKYWKTAKLTAPPDSRMSMCADYVKSRYEEETDEYRQTLKKRADTEYKLAMDEYNKRDALDGTPESYEHAWNEADSFLHVFVDAIAKKFGMSVSLLLTGPLGSEQGKIVMRSAHSNNVGAMTSLIWLEFDKQGFKAVQDSIIRYGEAVFSPEECKRRIPQDASELDEDGEDDTSAGLDEMNEAAHPYPKTASSYLKLPEPPSLLDGHSYPQPHEPMNLIAGCPTPMNFETPLPLTQPQGEFTALLSGDWNWPNALNWGDTGTQQPFWNNNHSMPFHPLFSNASSGPNIPMPMPINPTLSVAAMPVVPAAPLSTLTAAGVATPVITTPGAATPAVPVVPAAPLPTSTTAGVTTPVVPAAPLPQAAPLPTLTTPRVVTPAAPPPIITTPEAGPPVVPAAPLPILMTPRVATPVITTPGVAMPAVPVVPATPLPILTTPGAATPVEPASPSVLSTPGSVEPTLTGKENELPAKKKQKRVEPADTKMQGRPQRTSKPPTHLKNGGYVPPSKGTRKQGATKPAAKKKKK
ncbi:hypothetical protein BDN71DRAFT_1499826 [Pleurotus eryngii]|uniref:Uncharacterized protein n=1 Tax=Pleurotus eryngii TaxID=5323 RepID=A0A9P5ZJU0_PLEER|nr:hypothetical protein BDN71DRAFT_1499826 [Pleurotus eryngii]